MNLLRLGYIVNRGRHLGGGVEHDAEGNADDNQKDKEEGEKSFGKKAIHFI